MIALAFVLFATVLGIAVFSRIYAAFKDVEAIRCLQQREQAGDCNAGRRLRVLEKRTKPYGL